MKNVALPDFLTEEQIQAAWKIWQAAESESVARCRIRDEIIVPNMSTINGKLGQENHADYLAWAVIYVFMRVNSMQQN